MSLFPTGDEIRFEVRPWPRRLARSPRYFWRAYRAQRGLGEPRRSALWLAARLTWLTLSGRIWTRAR